MHRELERVMLVDDHANTNLYNEIVLNDAKAAKEIIMYQSAKDALIYLEQGNYKVDVIFLDVNMPVMDGWQFLEKHNIMEDREQDNVLIVMLTASINSEDQKRALSNHSIDEIFTKPLTVEVVEQIVDTYWKKFG